MLHVMKYNFPTPEATTEYGYLEIVHVKNGIGLVKEQATVDYLLSVGYDEIGQIEKEEDLPKFLEELNKPAPEPFTGQLVDAVPLGAEVEKPDLLKVKVSDIVEPEYWWQK